MMTKQQVCILSDTQKDILLRFAKCFYLHCVSVAASEGHSDSSEVRIKDITLELFFRELRPTQDKNPICMKDLLKVCGPLRFING